MRKMTYLSMLLCLLPGIGLAQTIIAYESFEQSAQEHGYTTMPSSQCVCCGVNDTWERTSDSGCVGPTIDGMDGTYYWVGEDIDDSDIQDATSALIAPYTAIILNTVDVSDYTNLEINLMAAVGMTGYFQLGDFLKVQYAFDADITAGNYTTAAQFIADAFVDDDLSFDADGNGSIDGASLTNTLTDFNISLGAQLGDDLSVRVLFNCNSFSEEIIVDYLRVSGILSPLPVSWLSFEVDIEGEQALLKWSTSIENNNRGFEVERSADSRNWTNIGFVAGQGDTNVGAIYSYIDENLPEGQSFYRLRQIDEDGRFTYSDIRTIEYIAGGVLSIDLIYPNPVYEEKAYIHIYSPKRGFVEMSIIDIHQGRQILTQNLELKAGMNELEQEINHWPNGLYLLRIGAGEQISYRRLLINH